MNSEVVILIIRQVFPGSSPGDAGNRPAQGARVCFDAICVNATKADQPEPSTPLTLPLLEALQLG